VIYDDRKNVRAGVMFSDADLLGVPLRVVVSPRNIEEGCCEIVSRDKSLSLKEPLGSSRDKIIGIVGEMMKKFEV
jgi:prolyl-tRNA synthetase